MIYPAAFLKWGSLDLNNKWLILLVVQTVMFGMGTQMSLRDFAGVVRSPRGVLVGTVGRFTVMPLAGWALIKLFHFPDEIAAGVILIGSCSSGLASNVMAYLARANLALSVTITAFTTLLAPLMTPLWMKLLAGTLVEVSFFKMMMEIIKIVLVPIGAALLHDYLKHAPAQGRQIVLVTQRLARRGWLFLAVGGWACSLKSNLVGHAAPAHRRSAVFCWARAGHRRRLSLADAQLARLDRRMPVTLDGGHYLFHRGDDGGGAGQSAAGRRAAVRRGGVLHNVAGYVFGYWLSRAAGLDKNSARSVAFEVGLQNGGMASGLAGAMGKLGTVGLAAAIFSPWMNVSGSVLANYWRKRPVN